MSDVQDVGDDEGLSETQVGLLSRIAEAVDEVLAADGWEVVERTRLLWHDHVMLRNKEGETAWLLWPEVDRVIEPPIGSKVQARDPLAFHARPDQDDWREVEVVARAPGVIRFRYHPDVHIDEYGTASPDNWMETP